jgi:hypothetical protein
MFISIVNPEQVKGAHVTSRARMDMARMKRSPLPDTPPQPKLLGSTENTPVN